MRFLGLTLLCLYVLNAAPPALRQVRQWRAPSLQRGGAPDITNPSRFYTWGDAVHLWDNGTPRQITTSREGFQQGGCAIPAGIVLASRSAPGPLGDLVLLRAPRYLPETIDTDVELRDCLPATLFGHSGFLMIHRHTQVRFYYQKSDGWAVQEIYSIYTASRQSGLALKDVDADGRPDIYAGNYWVRSPEAFQLPWHIFAIHLHNESDDAASFSYAAWPHLLLGVQYERTQTPVRIFTRPKDPRQIWPETTLSGVLLDHPRAALPFRDWGIIGHAHGLLLVDPQTRQSTALPGPAVLSLWQSGDAVYALSAGAISVWRK